jgi:hypothetical protein
MKISNPGFCIGFVILGSTWPINALYIEDTYPVFFGWGGGGGGGVAHPNFITINVPVL